MAFLASANRVLWKFSTAGLQKGAHITRYGMYREIDRQCRGLDVGSGRTLSISHSDKLFSVMGVQPGEIVRADYPGTNMLDLPYPDDSFDLVVSDQVLEHIEGDPQRAVDESLRVVRPNGVVLHTTCFINPIHGAPSDYWRFTPEALALLHKEADVSAVGGWGSFIAWLFIRSGLRMVPVPHARWHPLNWAAMRNNPSWPICTWVIAQKKQGPSQTA